MISKPITGIDGTVYQAGEITYDPANYTFTGADGEDLTNNIHLADMYQFAGFDGQSFISNRSSIIRSGKTFDGPLSTNTTGNFLKQIVTDPLDAPIQALPSIGKGLSDFAGTLNSDIMILGVVALAGVFGYMVLTHKK